MYWRLSNVWNVLFFEWQQHTIVCHSRINTFMVHYWCAKVHMEVTYLVFLNYLWKAFSHSIMANLLWVFHFECVEWVWYFPSLYWFSYPCTVRFHFLLWCSFSKYLLLDCTWWSWNLILCSNKYAAACLPVLCAAASRVILPRIFA